MKPVTWNTIKQDGGPEVPPSPSSNIVGHNKIYLYSRIDRETSLQLIKDLYELSLSPLIIKTRTPIQLHIQSEGGELFSAFAIADHIRNLETPVQSIVEGYCASAATIISISCDKRFITKSSFMMIHQLSALVWGTYEELLDEMKLSEMAMDKLIAFYKEHSVMSRKQIKGLLKRDSWFDAKECLKLGLVDVVLS